MRSISPRFERWDKQRTAKSIAVLLGASLVGYELTQSMRRKGRTDYGYFDREKGSLTAGTVADHDGQIEELSGSLSETGELQIESDAIGWRSLRRVRRSLAKKAKSRITEE